MKENDFLYLSVITSLMKSGDYDFYTRPFSEKQLQCKNWLVDELFKLQCDFSTIHLFGGWTGYPLIDLIKKYYEIDLIRNIDIDPRSTKACARYSKAFGDDFVKTATRDVSEPLNEDQDIELVVNTSCEHMKDMKSILAHRDYNSDCVFALQSTDLVHDEHINCVNSTEELIIQCDMKEVFYEGELQLKDCKRYMIIGKR